MPSAPAAPAASFDDAGFARDADRGSRPHPLRGLQTSWRRLRSVAVPAGLLSTIGVVVTALLTGLAAQLLFDLTWLEAILLGAVVASTDAAAVFATLRYTRLRRRVARTLEAESGGNDPMAIALTLGLIAWIETPDSHGFGDLVLLVVRQLALGLAVGVILAAAATSIFARLPRSVGPFAPVASLSAAGLSFGAADVVGGSGFLSVYLVGLAVGSTPSRYRRQLVGFHEGLAFLAQVVLFVVLGLLASLTTSLTSPSPASPSPHCSCCRSGRWRSGPDRLQRLHGPREACSGGPGSASGADRARDLRAFVGGLQRGTRSSTRSLFVVLVSAIPGHHARVGRGKAEAARSGLAEAEPPIELGESSTLDLLDFVVADDHAIAGAAVREVGLPRTAIIAVVVRDDASIPPRGSTVIEPGDRLLRPGAARNATGDRRRLLRWQRRV
jgi:cell volume regulation protein A